MPVVQPGSKVFVTGSSGYVGMWVVRTLLEDGYVVRGAVRSEEKGRRMKDFFESYGDEKFDFIVIPEMVKVGLFSLCTLWHY